MYVSSSGQNKKTTNHNNNNKNNLRGSTSLTPPELEQQLEDDNQQIREALMFVTQYVLLSGAICVCFWFCCLFLLYLAAYLES